MTVLATSGLRGKVLLPPSMNISWAKVNQLLFGSLTSVAFKGEDGGGGGGSGGGGLLIRSDLREALLGFSSWVSSRSSPLPPELGRETCS